MDGDAVLLQTTHTLPGTSAQTKWPDGQPLVLVERVQSADRAERLDLPE